MLNKLLGFDAVICLIIIFIIIIITRQNQIELWDNPKIHILNCFLKYILKMLQLQLSCSRAAELLPVWRGL